LTSSLLETADLLVRTACEETFIVAAMPPFLVTPKTVVIDPGHGGIGRVGGSDGNHAVTPSGVLEKDMTLQLALLVETELNNFGGSRINVVLTRRTDINLGLAARAHVARDNNADIFLSIHFNGFDGRARGVATHVRRPGAGNVNLADDRALAQRIQDTVFNAIHRRDAGTRDRGVRQEIGLGVLSDPALGNTAASHPCRACLLEVEFIDVPAVDVLLNTGISAPLVRREIAKAISDGILADLAAHP
jgi:N-acetylmuramoyl-L-alanine amidase